MYATREDMLVRFVAHEIVQLENMHNDGLDATNKALKDATEQINSYVSVRYSTPVNKTEYLTVIACNIARYRLYMVEATDEVKARYDEAVAWLKDVAAKKANITFAEPLTPDEQSKTYIKAVTPIGGSYPGQYFGDDVFATMPTIKGGFNAY